MRIQTSLISLVLIIMAGSSWAESPLHTYSIVARDAETGDMGVAVQSHWFSVGPHVAWAEAGVGAVATQSLVEISYGPLGLELMKAGKSASQALRALLVADEHPEIRQVAMIDHQGNVSVHTGKHCIAEAGDRQGKNYSVQANLMLNDNVPDAMKKAFENAKGPLAERMMTALEAAQAAGGDIRGKQSAALIVVRGQSTGKPWEDRLIDLRIDDHAQPIKELRRLLGLHRAYDHMNAGDLAMETSDFKTASREYGAAEALQPENAEMLFWHGVTLATAGLVDEAKPLLARAYALEPNWRRVVGRLVASKLFPDDPKLVKELSSLKAVSTTGSHE